MPDLSQLRILLVDDSVVIRQSASMLLRALGLESIEVAEDGVVALAVLHHTEFDLVLTDINMPNMNGFDLLQAIKNDDCLKHVPVLMVTAEARKEDIVLAAQLGAAGYIIKPFHQGILEERIRVILARATTKA